MSPKRLTPSALPRGGLRPLAVIAARANCDTIFGGCSALTIARRAVALRLPLGHDMLSAVSNVYATSSGRVPDAYAVCECSECGQVHVGTDAAYACCACADETSEDEIPEDE